MGGGTGAVVTKASNILGVSAYYHDSAAALLKDGELVAAAQQERFSRKKHDAAFPADAIRYCLDAENLDLSELDRIVFYDKPLIKFERLLETYLSNAPRGFRSFVAAMPVWLKEKLYLKSVLKLARPDNRRHDPARRPDRIRAGIIARSVYLYPVLKKIPAANCGYFFKGPNYLHSSN